jgi:hypothetical protein
MKIAKSIFVTKFSIKIPHKPTRKKIQYCQSEKVKKKYCNKRLQTI